MPPRGFDDGRGVVATNMSPLQGFDDGRGVVATNMSPLRGFSVCIFPKMTADLKD